jgi:hypothetical protein
VTQCAVCPTALDQLQCYCVTACAVPACWTSAAAVLDASLGVPLARAATQLLDFGERTYPVSFPGHPATRQLPGPSSTATTRPPALYLGVVVQSDSRATCCNGIYLLGGAWGNSLQYLGRVSDFIVPR